MNYYSQHGEDFLIDQLFKGKTQGFFVEVGCIDGKRFSNTLHFEEKGWKGIGIEAHNDFIPLMEKNRPNSINVHAAVSNSNGGFVTFYANSRGSLSTIDKSKEDEFAKRYGEYFTGFQEQKVPLRTLTSIFEEYKIKEIDFLSLDIEGNEYAALQGLDFNKYKPKVMIVECDEKEDENKILKLIKPFGYKKSIKITNNQFFILPDIDESPIKNLKIKVKLLHTEHPLDNTGDIEKEYIIDTRKKGLLNKFI